MNAGRPKDLEKRKRILEAAKCLFLECGYHGCSMNRIAQKADVSKLTVYNHFQDKETLFTSAIAETCDQLLQARPMHLSAGSDFRQALQQASQRNPLAQQFYNASHEKLSALWESFFAQAAALRFIRADAPHRQTLLIFSLLLGLRHHEVLMGIRPAPDQAERAGIIQDSIELFLLRYALP